MLTNSRACEGPTAGVTRAGHQGVHEPGWHQQRWQCGPVTDIGYGQPLLAKEAWESHAPPIPGRFHPHPGLLHGLGFILFLFGGGEVKRGSISYKLFSHNQTLEKQSQKTDEEEQTKQHTVPELRHLTEMDDGTGRWAGRPPPHPGYRTLLWPCSTWSLLVSQPRDRSPKRQGTLSVY